MPHSGRMTRLDGAIQLPDGAWVRGRGLRNPAPGGPLPEFGGEGMYGARVHQSVVASGVPESAVVIHVVDEEYDHGRILAQRAIPVLPGETAESLERRVRAIEPPLVVETLRRLARGELNG